MVPKPDSSNPLASIHPRPLKYLSEHLEGLVKGRLWLKIIIAMVFGILAGFLMRPYFGFIDPATSYALGEWMGLPGNVFLRVIQMIVIPLIFASIIRGIAASESMQQLKKKGTVLAIYFILTTTLAIVIGIALASWLNPGQFVSQEFAADVIGTDSLEINQSRMATPSFKEIPGLVGTLLPTNPLGSAINGEMLQLVIFSLIFGIALVNMDTKQSRPLLELLGSLQQVCMTIVKWAMLLAPLAVFGLMAQLTSRFGIETLTGLSAYVGVVLLGLVLLLVFYLALVWIVAGKNPWVFMGAIRDAQLLAFSTSSSAVVMPLSMRTAEEKLGVRPSISHFIIPLGATVNMDGTALYQGVAAVFLAQVFGLDLGLSALAFIVVTVVVASIGAPATPGIGIAILSLVLGGVGIPAAGIALIFGVDRILDMSRTAINVTGDLTACLVMDKWVGGEKTAEEQLKDEAKREELRKKTKADVITVKAPAPKASSSLSP
ncbi:dicarboxylate/amino acid:cation symporter [Candidatus Micrarchaeota archaeon]|nr:dicarboxylate/amino acid:cation symporter [Candidatus Micrarchaeota archaeon]